jgi:protein tyrosine phosphatase (PTP) superfamily phosphohydrolase (DUF442 family)
VDKNLTVPVAIAGIQNFGWVEPGVLARGEQPALEDATFTALRELGIRTVLSLRPDGEQPSPKASRPWPEYHVQDEHTLVERAGLRFRHVPMFDFSAPSPEEMAAALTVVEAEAADAPAVYVHCRAGAGRTALVAGAWLVARGWSGDRAAAEYVRFLQHLASSTGMPLAEQPAYLRRVGQPAIWWALREIVAALGSPVTHDPPFLLPAERPPGAADYGDALRPWHGAHNGRP